MLSVATLGNVHCVELILNPEAFRAIRLLGGWTLAAAARELGVTASHLSNIEAGRRGASPSLIKRASLLFGVPTTAITYPMAAAQ